MLKIIGGVVVGYIVMFILLFVIFSLAYLVLGANGSFKPGTYDVSTLWLAISVIVGLVAAIVGGFICSLIAPNSKAPLALVGLVLVLGLLGAIPALKGNDPRPNIRDASVGNLEAMMNARQPAWIALLNPLIGAVGVMLGSRVKK
ncbi:MAG: hypothetical protein JNK38_04005 [Acidobacteria bacterium]|nr:hypothetical protein [Acidobacteriota bacterium]